MSSSQNRQRTQRATCWASRARPAVLVALACSQVSQAFINPNLIKPNCGGIVVRERALRPLAQGGDVTTPQQRYTAEALQDQELWEESDSFEEMLELCASGSDVVSPSHLAQTVLRAGRLLSHPRHQGERKAIQGDPRFTRLLSAWHMHEHHDTDPRMHSDLLLGLALLQYPVPDYLLTSTLQALDGASRSGLWSLPEHVCSDVSWALHHLHQPPTALPQPLKEEADALPFRVLPGLLGDIHLDVHDLEDEVAFSQLKVFSRKGEDVGEERLTAWQGSRSCFHNGRELPPAPMTRTVSRLRDLIHRRTGVFFDGVLLNLYKNGQVGKHYHSDPDQGELWTDKTAILSIGDPRYFCLRRRPSKQQQTQPPLPIDRHRFLLSEGDVVVMFRDCQDAYQHCVERDEFVDSEGEEGRRISLVFKQSLVHIPRRRKEAL